MARRFARVPDTVALISGGDLDCARYNILGVCPWLKIKATASQTVLASSSGEILIELDPFSVLERILALNILDGAALGSPLTAGLLGYLSYDLKDCLEELPHLSTDDLCLPQLYMCAHSIIVVEDRHTHEAYIHLPIIEGAETRTSEHLAWFKQVLVGEPTSVNKGPLSATQPASGFSRQGYLEAVSSIRDYIAQGHVYQVNMSQRFEAAFGGEPYDLFARLFSRNPAPFFAYINAGDHQIVSTSPERFLLLNGNTVETRPIKGTRPRSDDTEQDQRSKLDLCHSKKDDAELSMIVDLLRNDIGKVCRAGSVHVEEHKRLEAYQNVYHLVSIVRGTLDENRTSVDLLRATFPGGSITGCPKIRAMEIIDELEPVRRHIYTGAIGYVSFHQTMDLSIAIRTATVHAGRLLFSVGGGVVYDSDPNDEFEETLHKGRTLLSALEAPTSR
jgi:para-aminobenzoate synthetase component 1